MMLPGRRRRAWESWSMWKDVLATFFGALGAMATIAGPVMYFTFDWMRERDRVEAAVLVRLDQVEKQTDAQEARADRERRELTERLARMEGLLLGVRQR